MDHCSAYGSVETPPSLENVEILFLPPNTTGKLQALDAGTVAAMKVRFCQRRMEHAVDVLDEGELNIYENDILTALVGWELSGKWLADLLSATTRDLQVVSPRTTVMTTSRKV